MDETCLLKDKYAPVSLDGISHNKDLIDKLKKFSKHKTIENILFTGCSGCGKYIIAKSMMATIIGDSVYKIKTKKLNIETKNGTEEIELKYSNFHYELNAMDFKYSDMFRIIDFIKQYTMHKNIFTNLYHIILIKNFDIVSKNVQYALRRIMEKNINTCRFILLAKSLSKIENAIISRSLLFRVKSVNESELTKILETIINLENRSIPNDKIYKIVSQANRNITTGICLLEMCLDNIENIKSLAFRFCWSQKSDN